MKGRLGVYDKREFDPEKSPLEAIQHQAIRMEQAGGNLQQERMIKDKRRSLDHAVWFSYQGAKVLDIDSNDKKPIRALINPNKLKQDYDDKIISIGYEFGFRPGTIFEWLGTKTYWLIYLQDLTELAYFRGDIRKCSYEIAWKDDKGYHSTYVAVRGPVETKINFIQKHNISVDTPNHSLNLLIPNNQDTLNYFKRYQKFYLQGDDTCWRIEAIDAISTPGILEVTAVEYYANETNDNIDAGIVDGFIQDIKDPNADQLEYIVGDTFIKVKKEYHYQFNGDYNGEWQVDSKYPVILTVDKENPQKVILKWDSTYSGQFELQYGIYNKTIVVESMFG